MEIDKSRMDDLARSSMCGTLWAQGQMLRGFLVDVMEYVPEDYWKRTTILANIKRTEHLDGSFEDMFKEVKDLITHRYYMEEIES